MTKEKYDLALHSLYECANNCDVAYVGSKNSKCNREFYILDELIEEHFELIDKYNELEEQHTKLLSQWGKSDNPPLKFEELKENMWVWDNKKREWLYIVQVGIGRAIGTKYFHYLGIYRNLRELKDLDMVFEENRFYKMQVKDNG